MFPFWQRHQLNSYMDNFRNQARCECKMIFEIHVLALVFMCCGWSINWVKLLYTQHGHWTLIHFGFLWNTKESTIALPKGKTTQVETWAKKLIVKLVSYNSAWITIHKSIERVIIFNVFLKKFYNLFGFLLWISQGRWLYR